MPLLPATPRGLMAARARTQADSCREAALAALAALEVVCMDRSSIPDVVARRPALRHLGEAGLLLAMRLLALPVGLKYLTDFVTAELEAWRARKNLQYAHRVDRALNAALGLFRSPDIRDSDPSCRLVAADGAPAAAGPAALLPVHFYAELCQTVEGVELLRRTGHVAEMVASIRALAGSGVVRAGPGPAELPAVKSALWAVGHVASR